MKRHLTFLNIAILSIGMTACTPQVHEAKFKITNSSEINRADEGITFTRELLIKELGEWQPESTPAVFDENDQPIPFQLDDIDGDGNWDELFFMVDVPKNASKTLVVRESKEESTPTFKVRTNIRFAKVDPPFEELKTAERLSSTDTKISQKYFQMEGPAWENEKVAFRNYFDARNGIDIYGKRVPDMILDKVGINGQNYHELDDWGMDILSVGTSLGAGAIALEIQDSIYRINYTPKADIRMITEGPLKSSFELNFPKWKAAGRTYDVKHIISILAGKRYYQSKVYIKGIQGDERLVTGLVNIHNDTLYRTTVGQSTILSTHDRQAYDSEYLGMALLVNTDDFDGTEMAPEEGNGIIQTHLIKLKIKDALPVVFRSYSCWEFENEKFKDRSYFTRYLTQEANEKAKPLTIKFIKN